MVTLSTEDLYSYLVEIGFIMTGVVLCGECGGSMVTAPNKDKSAGVHYVCKNKIVNAKTGRLRVYGRRKSAMNNSWFSKSKLNLVEFPFSLFLMVQADSFWVSRQARSRRENNR